MSKPKSQRVSRVLSPELDWGQVHEMIRMLELSAGQIESAMTDSDGSVDILTSTFVRMVAQIRTISDTVISLPDTEQTSTAKALLAQTSEDVAAEVQQAVVAFQFYDKLGQRLTHVTQNLASLSELVADRNRMFLPSEWEALQDKVRSRYTMDEERFLFEAVMNGATVKEALEQLQAEMKDKQYEIEYF